VRRQDEAHDLTVRRALAFVHGFAVDVHRGTDVRVAHQFLLHFHGSPRLIKQGPEGVPERVPAYASYAATNACGNDMTPLYSPGIPGHPARHVRACEHPVLGIFEERRALPTQEHFSQCGIKRDACIGVFGFHIAAYVRDPSSAHSTMFGTQLVQPAAEETPARR
jgi:hypothetical protein